MSGGKSKSNSGGNKTTQTQTTTTTTTNTSAEASGLVNSTVLQAQSLAYTNNFGPEVQATFADLIDLSRDAGELLAGGIMEIIDLANKAVDTTGSVSANALAEVSKRVEQQEQPEYAFTKELIPVIMIATVGFVLLKWKGK